MARLRDAPKAVLFDVFGTLVDWRGSVIAGLSAFGAARGISADWAEIADSWRRAYRPSMDRVRRGLVPWTILDDLHRDALMNIARRHEIGPLDDADCEHLVRLWHRLAPWPDVAEGLGRLKSVAIIGPLSNGHLALQVSLAKRNLFPWDVTFGADLFRHYKPDAEVYLGACDLLGLAPDQVMLAAAHNDDLAAAASFGLATAFISRPAEHGPGTGDRAKPAEAWDIVTDRVGGIAEAFGV
ncbi:haloacid dehalogenase type II [Acidiphilium acidophilum]|uniref:(S)-2-haloacid dehalogenase n=1 Tax=Acidiphilium acidophilum TaxID=76588 RepID=A0AAW9DSE6_ACIAO|nr:haloacid dehalogenase type II [Acidiphilium acidophilum]MDX5931459.1 haloacid dehalogenase type II [Acidiphilium acidophilum]